MDIQIQLKGVQDVIDRLKEIPDGARWAIHHSIKDALATGKTEITKAIRDRYNVPYGWVQSAIGNMRVQGLTGSMQIAGTRVPLYLFPHRDIYPYGVAIEEIKDAPPINLLHAFTPGNKGVRGNSRLKIYQREGPGGERYPIRWIMGLSVPQMAGEIDHIVPRVEHAMEYGHPGQKDGYYNRMEHYINMFLSGSLVPGYRLSPP
jgi:hypothetical protein